MSNQQDGNRPIAMSRQHLGQLAREAWIRAETKFGTSDSHQLAPFHQLPAPEQEFYCAMAEAVARWTLIGDATQATLDEMAKMSFRDRVRLWFGAFQRLFTGTPIT